MRSVINVLIFGFLAMSLIAGMMSVAQAQPAEGTVAPFVIDSFVDKARLGRSPRESARAQHYARLTELNRSILDSAPKIVARSPSHLKKTSGRKAQAVKDKPFSRRSGGTQVIPQERSKTLLRR